MSSRKLKVPDNLKFNRTRESLGIKGKVPIPMNNSAYINFVSRTSSRFKLNEEVIDSIVNSISRGHSLTSAAYGAEVTPPTLSSWLEQGEQELNDLNSGKEVTISLYAILYSKVMSARYTSEDDLIKQMDKLIFEKNNPTVLTFKLSKINKERWGNDTNQHTNEKNINHVVVTVEECDNLDQWNNTRSIPQQITDNGSDDS